MQAVLTISTIAIVLLILVLWALNLLKIDIQHRHRNRKFRQTATMKVVHDMSIALSANHVKPVGWYRMRGGL